MTTIKREMEIARAEYIGPPFNVRLDTGTGDPGPLQRRTVRIVRSIRPDTGRTVFRAASKSPTIVSDLPHLPLEEALKTSDIAETDVALTTARKGGASTAGVDMEEIFRGRGGTGKRLIKKGGFFIKSSAHEIAEIRRKRGGYV